MSHVQAVIGNLRAKGDGKANESINHLLLQEAGTPFASLLAKSPLVKRFNARSPGGVEIRSGCFQQDPCILATRRETTCPLTRSEFTFRFSPPGNKLKRALESLFPTQEQSGPYVCVNYVKHIYLATTCSSKRNFAGQHAGNFEFSQRTRALLFEPSARSGVVQVWLLSGV